MTIRHLESLMARFIQLVLFSICLVGCGTIVDRSLPLPPASDGGPLPLKARVMLYFPESQRDRPFTSFMYGKQTPTSLTEGRPLMTGAADAFRKLFPASEVNVPAVIPQIVIVLSASANWNWVQGDHETQVTATVIGPNGETLGAFPGSGRMGFGILGDGISPIALEGSFYEAYFKTASDMVRDRTVMQKLRQLEQRPDITVSEKYLRSLDLPASAWAWKDQPQLRP